MNQHPIRCTRVHGRLAWPVAEIKRLLERVHDLSVCTENVVMRKTYASDISREKFEEIRPLLQGVRRRTKPQAVDLYEVFCAVLYLLRTGCQWRFLPSAVS